MNIFLVGPYCPSLSLEISRSKVTVVETAVTIIEYLAAILSVSSILFFLRVNNPLRMCLALIGLALFTGLLS